VWWGGGGNFDFGGSLVNILKIFLTVYRVEKFIAYNLPKLAWSKVALELKCSFK
jgi:hypothetical protein